MNSVTIIHVGDFKEKFFKEAEGEYIKRLKAFCDYKTLCIKEETCFGEDSEKLIKKALEKEAAAIRAAARDEVFIDTTMARKFTQIMTSPGIGVSSLTERERTVLQLVGTGKSNKDIARELHISERTARTHVSNVLGKLNLSSRTQAALLAVNVGLTAPTF